MNAIDTILVVGKGSMGIQHFQNIKRQFGAERVLHVGSRFLDEVLRNGEESLHLPEGAVAVLASPASRHFDQLLFLISKNVPILVEKPLSDTSASIPDLVVAASSRGVPVQVGYQLHFSSGFKKFRQIIEQKSEVPIAAVNILCQTDFSKWRKGQYLDSVSASKFLGGGVLLELSHELAYTVELFGRIKPTEGYLFTDPGLTIDVETKAVVKGKLQAGSDVYIELDMASNKSRRYCEVVWSDGAAAKWNLKENSVVFSDLNTPSRSIRFTDTRDNWLTRQFESFLESCRDPNSQTNLLHSLEVLQLVDEVKEKWPLQQAI